MHNRVAHGDRPMHPPRDRRPRAHRALGHHGRCTGLCAVDSVLSAVIAAMSPMPQWVSLRSIERRRRTVHEHQLPERHRRRDGDQPPGPGAQPGRRHGQNTHGTIGFFLLDFEYQKSITKWLALRAGVNGIGRLGTSLEALSRAGYRLPSAGRSARRFRSGASRTSSSRLSPISRTTSSGTSIRKFRQRTSWTADIRPRRKPFCWGASG